MVCGPVANWFVLFSVGRVQTFSFPRSTTSYELTGLQPSTEYIITLYTLYEGREVATPVSTASRGNQLQGGLSLIFEVCRCHVQSHDPL